MLFSLNYFSKHLFSNLQILEEDTALNPLYQYTENACPIVCRKEFFEHPNFLDQKKEWDSRWINIQKFSQELFLLRILSENW